MLHKEIKNDVHRWAQHLTELGHTKKFISQVIDVFVKIRGPINGCTCNNFGPRWLEDSLTGCCPKCWNLALECGQMMFVNGVKPVTAQMVEDSQSWGFDRDKIRELNKA
jgi:hypothetical protein